MPEGGSLVAEPRPSLLSRAVAWRDRTLADPRFRAWATRFPLTRPVARRRMRGLFDLCAGFVYAQILHACVELRLFDILSQGPMESTALARRLGLAPDRAERLLRAAASLRLLTRRGDRYGLGPLGAAMVGNPAVTAMVRHHAMLYADLADPVALLRAPLGGSRLGAYWPYGSAADPATLGADTVEDYSELMAASQAMVAAEILAAYDIKRHHCLLDVGGGHGAFLTAAAGRAPSLQMKLFDLPAVAASAAKRLAEAGVRAETIGGDMHRDAWPIGADLISLIRVLHDHDDKPALALLRSAKRALPQGGTLLLAEPMAQTRGAEPVAAYFEFYLLAMGSGRPRSASELAAMLTDAGFSRVEQRRTAAPMVASILVAQT